jgi:hypothetical protein
MLLGVASLMFKTYNKQTSTNIQCDNVIYCNTPPYNEIKGNIFATIQKTN